MPIFMGLGSVAAFVWSGFMLKNAATDIQLGFAAEAFFAGLILWGFAALFQRMNDERKR